MPTSQGDRGEPAPAFEHLDWVFMLQAGVITQESTAAGAAGLRVARGPLLQGRRRTAIALAVANREVELRDGDANFRHGDVWTGEYGCWVSTAEPRNVYDETGGHDVETA